MNLTELETKTKQELVDVAKEFDIASVNGLSKHDLAMRIMQAEAEREGNRFSAGILASSAFACSCMAARRAASSTAQVPTGLAASATPGPRRSAATSAA